MKVFGVSNFGWRISNPVILSAAVVCFYLFFRKFTQRSTALIIAGMLACSSYLMNFGKIGYDNPQAFFMLGLTLWLAAEAVFSRRPVCVCPARPGNGILSLFLSRCIVHPPLPVLLMAFSRFSKKQSMPSGAGPAASGWRPSWHFRCCFNRSILRANWKGLLSIFHIPLPSMGLASCWAPTSFIPCFPIYICTLRPITLPPLISIQSVRSGFRSAWHGFIVQVKRNKFALFWILSFLIMWFLAGASHGRNVSTRYTHAHAAALVVFVCRLSESPGWRNGSGRTKPALQFRESNSNCPDGHHPR